MPDNAEFEYGWFAVRTRRCKEMEVNDFLTGNGLKCFVPMTYVEKPAADNHHLRRVLKPAVHNYVFVQNNLGATLTEEKLNQCDQIMFIYRNENKGLYEIPAREMKEFRLMCDPDVPNVKIVDADEIDLALGKEVKIVAGSFKGLRGRLYRKQREFYFVKTVAGLGVMLRISRWYCKPV